MSNNEKNPETRSDEEWEKLYEQETGKNPNYRGSKTKAYLTWLEVKTSQKQIKQNLDNKDTKENLGKETVSKKTTAKSTKSTTKSTSKKTTEQKSEAEVKQEVKPQPKPEPKPEIKQEIKPQPKQEVKHEVKQEVKPQPKPEPKPEIKQEIKPQPKPESKPEMKQEIKPQPKPEVKQEVKQEVKPQPKPEVKQEVKQEIKPQPKQEVKHEVKQEVKPQPKPEPKPEVKSKEIEDDRKPLSFKQKMNQQISKIKKFTSDFGHIEPLYHSYAKILPYLALFIQLAVTATFFSNTNIWNAIGTDSNPIFSFQQAIMLIVLYSIFGGVGLLIVIFIKKGVVNNILNRDYEKLTPMLLIMNILFFVTALWGGLILIPATALLFASPYKRFTVKRGGNKR